MISVTHHMLDRLAMTALRMQLLAPANLRPVLREARHLRQQAEQGVDPRNVTPLYAFSTRRIQIASLIGVQRAMLTNPIMFCVGSVLLIPGSLFFLGWLTYMAYRAAGRIGGWA